MPSSTETRTETRAGAATDLRHLLRFRARGVRRPRVAAVATTVLVAVTILMAVAPAWMTPASTGLPADRVKLLDDLLPAALAGFLLLGIGASMGGGGGRELLPPRPGRHPPDRPGHRAPGRARAGPAQPRSAAPVVGPVRGFRARRRPGRAPRRAGRRAALAARRHRARADRRLDRRGRPAHAPRRRHRPWCDRRAGPRVARRAGRRPARRPRPLAAHRGARRLARGAPVAARRGAPRSACWSSRSRSAPYPLDGRCGSLPARSSGSSPACTRPGRRRSCASSARISRCCDGSIEGLYGDRSACVAA
ncbi:hypothetical protein [Nocardioides sp. B-3]|uniref:hypothetical protein n=1 Tax=Nocardioides sp. B-3 TaxID=2895565 RepID=UPI0021536632|nr:hypothetical protein [Nocardioides sp. B-3]UUZ61239.1 hypothetical protein LP418_11935 [Nocardioides sp. B-3]